MKTTKHKKSVYEVVSKVVLAFLHKQKMAAGATISTGDKLLLGEAEVAAYKNEMKELWLLCPAQLTHHVQMAMNRLPGVQVKVKGQQKILNDEVWDGSPKLICLMP